MLNIGVFEGILYDSMPFLTPSRLDIFVTLLQLLVHVTVLLSLRSVFCLCFFFHGNCLDSEQTQRNLATSQKIRDLQHESHLLSVLLLKQQTISKWRLGYHRVSHRKEVSSIAWFFSFTISRFIKLVSKLIYTQWTVNVVTSAPSFQ